MNKLGVIFATFAILSIKISSAAEREVSVHCEETICSLVGTKSKSDKLKISSINVNYKELTAATGMKYDIFFTGDETYPEHIPEGLMKSIAGIEGLHYNFSPLKYIKRSDFKDGSELRAVNLERNEIQAVPFDTFYDLKNIEFINLNSNKLRQFHPATFANSQKLSTLKFDYNQITELNRNLFKSLLNLKNLHGDSNRIVELPKDLFVNNQKLYDVSLGNNQLKNILVDFRSLKGLKHVSLADNYGKCNFVYFYEKPYSVQEEPEGWVYNIEELQRNVEEKCRKI
jgi:Leucine-rich repeat (LRR) protein